MSKLIENILLKALSLNASDLFITAGKKPSFRIHGKISFSTEMDTVSEADVCKFRAQVLLPEKEKLYQQCGTADASWTLPSGERFRLNFFTSANGSSIAIRPIGSGNDLSISQLNLLPLLETLCCESRGLILVTGSTGSGKSTTLGAMINQINRTQEKHILTIEDPIEFLYKNEKSLISQREVNPRTGGFAAAMRNALRENPDVIVIGEMRDVETIQAAVSASLTGHLVISTLHTSDTVQSVERLITMFPGHQREQAAIDLGMSLLAVISQRLIPLKDSDGMIPAVEVLLGTPSVRKSITEQNYTYLDDLLRRGSGFGMVTFTRDIFRLYKQDLITLEDALNTVSNQDEFKLLLKGMETGTDSFRNYYGEGVDFEDNSLVNMRLLLRMVIKYQASDLHLTVNSPPMLRINGILNPADLPPMKGNDIQRLLYSVITPRQKIELEEKRELDLALAVRLNQDDKDMTRFRVNAFFQRGNLGVVARAISVSIPSPESLALPQTVLNFLDKRQGLVLVTGPTGSGKSTTLACLIDQINQRKNGKKFCTESNTFIPIRHRSWNNGSCIPIP